MKSAGTSIIIGSTAILLGAGTALVSPQVVFLAWTVLMAIHIILYIPLTLMAKRCTHPSSGHPMFVVLGALASIFLARVVQILVPGHQGGLEINTLVFSTILIFVGVRVFITSHLLAFPVGNIYYSFCVSGDLARKYGALLLLTSAASLSATIVHILFFYF